MNALYLAFFFLVVHVTARYEKSYIVNLDDDWTVRYDQIVRDHREEILEIYRIVKKNIEPKHWDVMEGAFNSIIMKKFPEYAAELIGISRLLPGTYPSDIFIINCMPEFLALCTSIVARDKNNKVILARNFDFEMPNLIRRAHIDIIYTRYGRVVAKCETMAGFIGVITCMKPKAFAISMNARKVGILDFIRKLIAGDPLTAWVIRETVLQEDIYSNAMRRLEIEETAGPSYLTVAGMAEHEGAVITRNSGGVVSINKLSKEVWFLAKCNNDNDDDERTRFVIEAMHDLGQKKTDLDTVHKEVLSAKEVMDEYNIASVLMSPANSYYESILATTAEDSF